MKNATIKIALLVFCLSVAGAALVQAEEDLLEKYSTKDLNYVMKKCHQELKKMQDLEKKLASAARQSSNSGRNSAINNIQDHMGECILRREDDLGQDHTIQRHGGHMVTSGTTDAAKVGAPVGTSSAKTSLNYVEGIEGYRLRQLSMMQSLFVAAKQNMVPAIEKQGDSLDRYSSYTRRFREELERSYNFLMSELEKRDWEQQKEAADQEAENDDH